MDPRYLMQLKSRPFTSFSETLKGKRNKAIAQKLDCDDGNAAFLSAI